MLWKLHGKAFRILLGILFGQGDLPLDRFWRHVSFMIIVHDVVYGGCMEEVLFTSKKISFICHGYCRMAHMHPHGWSVKSKYTWGLSLELLILYEVDNIPNGVWICV